MQKYHFLYDDFGNTTSIGIGGWNSTEQLTLASYEYAAMNGLLTRQTYGNGDKVEFTYDILVRAKTTTYKDENGNVDRVLTYVYTGDGQLYSIHDSRTGFLYLYTYDSIGRLIGSSVKNSSGKVLMSTRQEYDRDNRMTGQHWTVGGTTYSETYTYSTVDGALTSYNNDLGQTVNLEYDALRRLSKVDTTTLDRNYTYVDVSGSQTTGLVSSFYYTTTNGGSTYYNYSYAYDALGNITSYTQSGTTYTYTYDDQNQLLTQAGGGKTYTYTYDNAGNIKTASNGTTTNSYTYGNALWRDQLTAFNGQTITYDGSGNPLSYYNGKRYTFTWEEGRNLVSAVQGTNTYTYAYDSNGLRVSKTVNGVKHEYLYASGKLLKETYGDVILDFVYAHNGHPFALRYTADGTTTNYYYITNLQGDVLYMINGSGTIVASYSYDPYGKVLSATGEMANINPLRYRGYYYDTETEFYYLQSRYYDSRICRLINADGYVSTGQGVRGYNMFAYCRNNPTSRVDQSGTADDFWGWVGEEIGEWIYELISGSEHPNNTTDRVNEEIAMAQVEAVGELITYVYENTVAHQKNIDAVNTQVIAEQNEMIGDVVGALWDAYVHSVELQAQQQYEHDMMVINHWEYISSSPTKLIDFVIITSGNIGVYSSYAALASAATVTPWGIIGVAWAVGTSIWSTLQYYKIIPDITWEDLLP